MQTFGEKIRDERKKRNWTQEYLGRRVGLQKSAVAKYENGRVRNVTTEIIERFAKALDLKPYELMNSFEQGLYALDYTISGSLDGVQVSNTLFGGIAYFSHDEWDDVCRRSDYNQVLAAVEGATTKKEAPAEPGEGLSESKKAVVDFVMSLSDDEARELLTFAKIYHAGKQ